MLVRQVARNCAKFDAFQVRAQQRKMRRNRFGPTRAHAVDDLEQQWRGRRTPDKRRVCFAIEISDPDAEHVMIENGNRPRVVETMGRSCFPKNRRDAT